MTARRRGAFRSGHGSSLRGRTAALVMLMRYTAVALLFAAFAAFATSAVRAQSPQRASPSSSSQPKGQWQELPVTPQPGSPLRISVKASWLADSGWQAGLSFYWMRVSVENISGRDIGLYGIRGRAVVGGERVKGPSAGRNWLPSFWQPGKALRPGQVDVQEKRVQYYGRVFPLLTYEIESVVFMDGTVWCTDECRLAEYAAGRLAGGRAAVGRLLKVLDEDGMDAVIKALMEKVAEDDPEPAVVVTTGELVDIKPPPGHSKEWEYGFLEITKSIADFLWQGHVLDGGAGIERRLRDAYRVEGAK